jgi:hypothetical protein
MVHHEDLFQILGEALQEELSGRATQHSLRTAECPAISTLADAAEHGLGPSLASHVTHCGYCCLSIRAAWSAHDEYGNEWAAAERVTQDPRSDDYASIDVRRGADALLSAGERLARIRLPADLRRRIADIAAVLADSIEDHDPSAADDLRRIGYAVSNTGPVSPPERSPAGFPERIAVFVAQLAAALEDEGDLGGARRLHISAGERSRAGRCSLRAGAQLRGQGQLEAASVALATAWLELGSEGSPPAVAAELGRLAAATGDVTAADDYMKVASEGYDAAGDDESAARLQAERASLGKRTSGGGRGASDPSGPKLPACQPHGQKGTG